MRIRTLQIEGFTSLRDEVTLDLENAELFAITGPTGAGKSSLLDAMTYALFGRVERLQANRGITDLISHHRPACKVLLTFDSGGHGYRVMRRTPRKGSTKILFERETERDTWVPACEGADRVKDAQIAIDAALGVDYEGFTRTVLLPQGRFAEFLVGDASKRREILTDLLGYKRIEALGKRAREIAGQAEAHAEAKQQLLDQTYQDATPERSEELNLQRKNLAEKLVALDVLTIRLAEIRDRASAAIESADALPPMIEALRRGADQWDILTGRRADLTQARQSAVSDQAAVLTLIEEATAAEATSRTALEQHIEAHGRDDELRVLDRILAARTARQTQIDTLVGRISAGTGVVDAADVAATHAEAEFAQATAALADAESEATEADAALEHARQADRVGALCEGLDAGDPCPVCATPLAHLPTVDAAVRERAIAAAAAAAQAVSSARQTQSQAARAVTEAKTGASHNRTLLNTLRTELVGHEAQRTQEDAALPEVLRDASDPVEALHRVLSDREGLERSSRGSLDALQRAERDGERALAHAEALAKELEHVASQADGIPGGLPLDAVTKILGPHPENVDPRLLRELADGLVSRLGTATDALSQADADAVAVVEPMFSGVHGLADGIEQAHRERDASTREDGRLEGLQIEVARRIGESAALSEQVGLADRRAELFKELGSLLKGNAFIEFLQEDAMRSLSAAATVQLERLSSGRYRLGFDSNEFHVLDTWNADERRPARTLSGGETFLASLALALSLADEIARHRIGTSNRLESLFLDEGFGTLDQGSLDEVVDAIEHLASQARTVGVITHIAELAQRLPMRIEVEKRPDGSRVTIRS